MEPQRSPEKNFIELIDQHKKLILKIAGAYGGNPEARKDLVQEIILQLWKSFPRYNQQYAISTWMYRIALNVSISFLRKETSRKKLNMEYQRIRMVYWEDKKLDEQLTTLHYIIGQLKPLDKAIIILHLEECKNSDIAEIMGLSLTNVSTRIHRIKQTLTSKFKTSKTI